MHKGTAFVLIAGTVVAGFAIGRHFHNEGGDGKEAAVAEAPAKGEGPIGGVERKRVPLRGEVKGSPDALVDIVEFSDFQCPFCGRVVPTIDKLMKDYDGKVRLYFNHYPLPFHADAPLAAQAAAAAAAQGKFWQMHDKLFANQQAIKRPDLEKYAQDIGLDVGKFKQALDSGTYKSKVEADTTLGGSVGVNGTPAFFINGRPLAGAYPYEEFKKVVDEEIATAKKLIASGTPKDKVYDKLMASAGAAPAAKPAANAAARPPVANEVYKVALGEAPVRGGKQPKVTIIEFSDFQCPFCGRATPTVKQILDTYKDDVAVAFKQLPLPFHNNAAGAAAAAVAAQEQGKFWEMHDKMFANQQTLDRPNLEKYAQEVGLDMSKFKAAMDGAAVKARIEADKAQATQFGVSGTPSFFLNGRKVVGAVPFDQFKTVIDEEITKANAKLKAGVARKDLYADFIKAGLEKVAPPPPRPGEASPDTVYKAEVGNSPMKGPKDALVTIVQYSDFQCPFCGRVEPTVDKVMEEYKGKVRVVWKDFPLDFHPNAMPAAIVGRVARDEGKFWPVHDKLFANQQTLDRANLEKYAGEAGLNVGRVKAALDAKKYADEIKADQDSGAKIGVRGTPAFFVNGTFLSGARPFEQFKERIDQQLAKAEALVKKGTPKAKVYDEIMKTATASVAAAPTAAAAPGKPQAGPEDDQTVFRVDPGSSPAKGPKNAPVTLVLFSDFQCPFCKRVEPTIAQLEKEYAGKIRVVWKDYPLPFHPNARPAAIVGRVAAEEGKFWQMHDKMFENQTTLDRTNLEKYAQEVGLNVSKVKSALDQNKFSSEIDSEAKAGEQLGVSGTPAAFINGRKISGAYPYETFKKVVDQELAKAKKRS